MRTRSFTWTNLRQQFRFTAGMSVMLVAIGAFDGFQLHDLWGLGVLPCGFALAWFFEAFIASRYHPYAILALLSALLGWMFISAGGDRPILGIIGWAGMTILGLIWCIYYQRTQPRSSTD